MSDLATLEKMAQKNAEGLQSVTKGLGALVDRLNKTPAYPNGANPMNVFGAPHARTGEDPLTSRGFSFLKMLGLLNGSVTPEQAKVEMDIHNRLHKALDGQYVYAGGGAAGVQKFLAPMATNFFVDGTIDHKFRSEMKSLTMAGCDGSYDLPDHMNWIRTKQLQSMGYGAKDLSWLNELTGGALVQPPELGELIELLRNKEALVQAGARTIPLPAQGRLTFPRQTAASLAYWVGENKQITQSEVGTGTVTLQGKKLAVLIQAPNELIRFASPAAEALIRDDITKTLALGLDLAGLEGPGGDTRPRGLINLQGINQVTSSRANANGDNLVGTDLYRMIAAVEESNAEFEGWVMRPKTLYKWYQLRSDAVAQGDNAGPFLFNLIREAGDGIKATLGGYPVTKSTQVSQVRSKGSASNLTYLVGGMFSDLLIGMFGGVEFATTTMGDTAFRNDQTWIRGILTADIAARHDAAFVWMDNLDTTL